MKGAGHQTRSLYCEVENVEELLLKLDTSKSNGPDAISGKMLTMQVYIATAACIAPSVTKFFNLSIRLGKLPDAWKMIHIIVPIPKASKSHLPNNYRPISLLCVLSKVLEKHIFTLIVEHLEEYYQLSDYQWNGFNYLSLDMISVQFFRLQEAFDIALHASLIDMLCRLVFT